MWLSMIETCVASGVGFFSAIALTAFWHASDRENLEHRLEIAERRESKAIKEAYLWRSRYFELRMAILDNAKDYEDEV